LILCFVPVRKGAREFWMKGILQVVNLIVACGRGLLEKDGSAPCLARLRWGGGCRVCSGDGGQGNVIGYVLVGEFCAICQPRLHPR